MDYAKIIVSNQKEESIGIQTVGISQLLLNVATDAHTAKSMDILTLYKFTITITPTH